MNYEQEMSTHPKINKQYKLINLHLKTMIYAINKSEVNKRLYLYLQPVLSLLKIMQIKSH